ncbi:hypothetical protein Q8F55_003545 [Vanrija albida]|uniref:Amino acid transporter transmembrane domain-containing protein n=1 Tax=Vanrija albida TaxID=181172 RepID=A0ABR3Q484_9TREE
MKTARRDNKTGGAEVGSAAELGGELGTKEVVHDAVWGEQGAGGPNYRAVSAFSAFVLITKADIGLGVLTLPVVFQVLGIVPGVLIILAVMAIVAYCAAQIGPFKQRHPECYTLTEAGAIFGGRAASEYFFVMYMLDMIFTVAGALISLSTALNALSTHGACTAVFVAVIAAFGFLCCSVRTLNHVAPIGWVGLFCLVTSVLVLAVSVGVQDRPADAPPTGDWGREVKLFGTPTFAEAMAAVNQIVFAGSATSTFFGIVSEMREPKQYTRSMLSSMAFLTGVYVAIGTVVYYYCGQYVSSPALGSAGPLMKKVCYGIAIPGLLASLTLYGHLAGKALFVRILGGSRHLTSSTPTHWVTWLGLQAGCMLVAYVIAEAIPNFSSVISLVGSIVKPSVSIIPYTFMWWHDNWRFVRPEERTARMKWLAALNVLLFLVGAFIMVAGTYGSVKDLIKTSASTGPWSCKDNSNSVHE